MFVLLSALIVVATLLVYQGMNKEQNKARLKEPISAVQEKNATSKEKEFEEKEKF